ncbi:MAG: DUF6752 domain-containing protein [Nocardioides sp.]
MTGHPARRCYLHVGSPKSGTSYLQRVLELNRDTLADAGVLVAGGSHLDLVHAAMVVREDPRLADLDDRARSAWTRLAGQVRSWDGRASVVSYELFAGASAEQVKRALDDLDGIEVHVVITTRDLAKAIPSAWQERLKFGLVTPLADWVPPPESAGPRPEWGWRTMDPAGVAARWGATLPPSRIHIVTAPRAAAPGELWDRFARACSLPAGGIVTEIERVNESLGLVETELLRRVNERTRAPIAGDREHAVWIRDVLAHGVLAGLGHEPIGLTEEQRAEAAERAEAAAEAITVAGYAVHGDLADIAPAATPDRAPARTPDAVTDAELVAAAVPALVALLLRLRAQSGAGTSRTGEPPRRGPRQAAKGLLARLAEPYVNRGTTRLRERVEALEAEVARTRALQLRVAVLQDVVTELLQPLDAADPDVTRAALRAYRKESL